MSLDDRPYMRARPGPGRTVRLDAPPPRQVLAVERCACIGDDIV